ncbi:MAG: DUF2797 domain-containing protein [Bacteriovoracaceae bacterium]|nr:DUF2797 domain-containing protein [Bacteriovoracaceae bacterium]
MRTSLLDGKNVNYEFVLAQDGVEKYLPLNASIGKKITLKSHQVYECLNCQKQGAKSYGQGYCFDCFSKLAECDMCIVKPELCHYDAGTCREPRWAERYCMKPHIVYLANSSGLKVGITREQQIPTRWLDQGAVQALPILKVETRYLSGVMEKALAQVMSDKTNWRELLKNEGSNLNMIEEREKVLPLLKPLIEQYGAEILASDAVSFQYPVSQFPEKIQSIDLDKTPEQSGVLLGIKGQYLIFDNGVLNVRKYTSLKMEINL